MITTDNTNYGTSPRLGRPGSAPGLRTKAIPVEDGSYEISGTKIFVSGGEQDITENIIHTVLARLPGAPDGTKGVSLFLVPKVLVKPDGSLGKANAVICGSIEKKMGLKGSATCVMNFDGAKGFLLGQEIPGSNRWTWTQTDTHSLSISVAERIFGEVDFQAAKGLPGSCDRDQ